MNFHLESKKKKGSEEPNNTETGRAKYHINRKYVIDGNPVTATYYVYFAIARDGYLKIAILTHCNEDLVKSAVLRLSKKIRLAPQLLLCLFLIGCAGPRPFGPYMGKVVDAETREPLEGAVVFIRFDTELSYITLGGPVAEYAGSVEVLTDKDGEFHIPVQWVKLFRMLHRWDPTSWGVVFKPGYGAFPRHEKSYRSRAKGKEVIPQGEFVTISLPKLETFKERDDNFYNITYGSICEIPARNQKLILKLINAERRKLGLKPRVIPEEYCKEQQR